MNEKPEGRDRPSGFFLFPLEKKTVVFYNISRQ